MELSQGGRAIEKHPTKGKEEGGGKEIQIQIIFVNINLTYIWRVKFTLQEIPQPYLDRLGLAREQLQQWPRRTREALLSGLRTSLVRLTDIRLPGSALGHVLDTRLSLFRKTDGAVGLRLHPAGPAPARDPILTDAERQRLQAGGETVIPKTVRDASGREREALVGLDPATGTSVAVDRNTLHAPRFLDGKPLSDKQRRDFTEGRPVELGDRTYRFDPAREGGIARGTTLNVSHSRVEDTDIAIDIALMASGLGQVILLEHLADMALHLRLQKDRQRLGDPAFRDTVARTAPATRTPERSRSPETVQPGAAPGRETDRSPEPGRGKGRGRT